MEEIKISVLVYLAVSVVYGGILAVLVRWIPSIAHSVFRVGGLLFILTAILHALYRWYEKTDKQFCQVEIVHHDKRVTLKALIDSGNGLYEPITHTPVCVVSKGKNVDQLDFYPNEQCIIPFHAVGTNTGILTGYRVDRMKIRCGLLKKEIQHPIIAFTKDLVSFHGKYQMILHPDYLNYRKEEQT